MSDDAWRWIESHEAGSLADGCTFSIDAAGDLAIDGAVRKVVVRKSVGLRMDGRGNLAARAVPVLRRLAADQGLRELRFSDAWILPNTRCTEVDGFFVGYLAEQSPKISDNRIVVMSLTPLSPDGSPGEFPLQPTRAPEPSAGQFGRTSDGFSLTGTVRTLFINSLAVAQLHAMTPYQRRRALSVLQLFADERCSYTSEQLISADPNRVIWRVRFGDVTLLYFDKTEPVIVFDIEVDDGDDDGGDDGERLGPDGARRLSPGASGLPVVPAALADARPFAGAEAALALWALTGEGEPEPPPPPLPAPMAWGASIEAQYALVVLHRDLSAQGEADVARALRSASLDDGRALGIEPGAACARFSFQALDAQAVTDWIAGSLQPPDDADGTAPFDTVQERQEVVRTFAGAPGACLLTLDVIANEHGDIQIAVKAIRAVSVSERGAVLSRCTWTAGGQRRVAGAFNWHDWLSLQVGQPGSVGAWWSDLHAARIVILAKPKIIKRK